MIKYSTNGRLICVKWQLQIGELMLNPNLQDLINFGWKKSGMIKLNYKVPHASIRDFMICVIKTSNILLLEGKTFMYKR